MSPSFPPTTRRGPQRGMLLLEALIAILICAFGLLGFVGMQARATSAEFESFQRSQALVLIEDMAARMNANRANAATYVNAGLIGGALVNCAGKSGKDLDVCEWGNLLVGSAETRNGVSIGSMINARGCITKAATGTDRYIIAIAWQGTTQTGAPNSTCGKNNAAFPAEPLRRVVSSVVCVAQLTGEAAAARC
jgi:type IV pilus assembly protein PilV